MSTPPDDRERNPAPDEAGEEEPLDRRAFLVSLGRYSAAVVSLVGGGAAASTLVGCGLVDKCSDDCAYAFDGVCDDGGEGSTYAACDEGTDCSDCGPRGSGEEVYYDYYSNGYGNSYDNYSNSYDNYSNSYSNYSNYYYNYYSNYYNYSA